MGHGNLVGLVLWVLRRADDVGGFGRAWFLTGVLITAALSALLSGMLWCTTSSRIRGVGLSVACSAAVLVVVGTVVAFLLYS
ncbi:hypothetical protein B1R94_22995 [Mycolicibacterium litorale]|nr:hypothetical protein B1R94_22995 [Mycolicibacterium litorale]